MSQDYFKEAWQIVSASASFDELLALEYKRVKMEENKIPCLYCGSWVKISMTCESCGAPMKLEEVADNTAFVLSDEDDCEEVPPKKWWEFWK